MSKYKSKIDVVVVTQDDPFYMPIFFEEFISELEKRVRLKKIVIISSFNESYIDLINRMYEFYGFFNFLYMGFDFVKRKLLDRSRHYDYSVKSISKKKNIEIHQRESVNETRFIDWVRQSEVDVLLSVSCPEIFRTKLLSSPKWGCLNVHTAKLPRYRGMLPTFWALYHGDKEVGVTVHTMEQKIDRGQIAKQSTFSVSSADTLDDVIKRGKKEGGRLTAHTLNALAEGDLQLRPMEGEESYFSFPTAEERRELQQKGRRLL